MNDLERQLYEALLDCAECIAKHSFLIASFAKFNQNRPLPPALSSEIAAVFSANKSTMPKVKAALDAARAKEAGSN